MMKGLYILGDTDLIYGHEAMREVEELIEITSPPLSASEAIQKPEILSDVEIIMSGWGGPHVNEEFLKLAPNLKAVFYGAGSIKGIVSDAFWNHGITISSSYGANGVPVAEYIVAQVLFCLKSGWAHALAKTWKRYEVHGAYHTTVGMISMGMIGRLAWKLLQPYDLEFIGYRHGRGGTPENPDIDEELNMELYPLLDVFRRSHVISCHTPSLPATKGMITGEHFAAMQQGACFINSARGAVVREDEMIEVLKDRTDIYVILDVTDPEPPEEGSPLYTLPNVVLTPHIAGSMGSECRRMGRYQVEELKRYLSNEPLQWEITREMFNAGMA